MELDDAAKMIHDSQLQKEVQELKGLNQYSESQIDRLKGELASLQDKYQREKLQNKVEIKKLKMLHKQSATISFGV